VIETMPLMPIRWVDDAVIYIDQRFFPQRIVYARAADSDQIVDAIVSGAVRGMGSIDLLAACGLALAYRNGQSDDAIAGTRAALHAALIGASSLRTNSPLSATSPALDAVAASPRGGELDTVLALLARRNNVDRSIARHAAALLPRATTVLTYGSTGALATGGAGTALGAIIAAHQAGHAVHALVGETGPRLGGRYAAGELAAAGVPHTVIPDSAIAAVIQRGRIDTVLVGALALAANGDVIGELGTYAIALAAAQHRIPLYVTTPRAAIDRTLRCADPTGNDDGIDMTPARFVSAIVTEYGVTRPPYDESIPALAYRPDFAVLADRT